MQTIAKDADNSIFDLTPLDLTNSVAIRAHAYKPIEPVTPATNIVLIPYDGTADQPVPGTNDSVSTSNILIDTVLTVTEPFSTDPNQIIPLDITESSVIMLFPESQIDLALQSFDPSLPVFQATPVRATFTVGAPGSPPRGFIVHTKPFPNFDSSLTPNFVDAPLGLIDDYYSPAG